MASRGLWCGLIVAAGCAGPVAEPMPVAHEAGANDARPRPTSTRPHAAFFVATYGSDLDPGTEVRPFATLERARQAIRELRSERGLPGPVTVWLRGGVYVRDAAFKLSAEDSGTPVAPITYRAYPGEHVRLVGGRELDLSLCRPVTDEAIRRRLDPSARDRVRQIDVREMGIDVFGELSMLGAMLELFHHGRRLPLARWPNEGWTHIGKVVEVDDAGREKLVDGNKRGTTFQVDTDRPERWRQADQMVLHGFWWFGWTDEHVRVRRIRPERRLIELEHVPGGGIRRNQWFCAVNLLEEIDRPGEWFLDRTTGVLTFWPPGDWPTYPIIISTLTEPLLEMNACRWVTVRGLVLEVARGTGVVISGGLSNRLAGCTVRCTGTNGLVVGGGRDNGVVGCDITQVGATAVHMTGGNRWTLEPSGNHVVNCHIHHYAQRKKVYHPAVRLYGCGHRIAHNLIHDAPHQAIGYDGNEHVIEFNEIHHVVMDSADAGVLYSGCKWTFRGTVVRHNFIHHIPHGPGLGTVCVYLDDCHASTAILGNVFYDMLKPTFIGGGRDNRIENNIFIACEVPTHLDNRGLRWSHFRPGGPMYDDLKRMRWDQRPWCDRYPKLATILNECPQAPLGNTLMRNVSVRSTWRDPEAFCRETSGKHIDRRYLRIEDNYVTDADPGFVDAAAMDFRLRDDSVVYREVPGFERIPFEKIGPYRDELRASWPIDDSGRNRRVGAR